jgi:hypothetical protein
MPLSDTQCKTAKPKEKPYKLTDEKGLYLLVAVSGGKWWRFNYRFEQKHCNGQVKQDRLLGSLS